MPIESRAPIRHEPGSGAPSRESQQEMTARREASAFAPASIGNVAVGFDVIGQSISGAGDVVKVRRIDEPLVRIAEFVLQHGHLALFLAGCRRGDASLVRAGLHDTLVEPRRAHLIPRFSEAQRAALDCNAMGSSISGAGPSVFAWFESRDEAERGGAAMRDAFMLSHIHSDVFISPVNGPRAEVVR